MVNNTNVMLSGEGYAPKRPSKYDVAYLEMAVKWGELSSCTRNQVGCLIVKDNRIISDGYNGTPSGHDNECEEDGVTKWNVLHAETNAIAKLAKLGGTGAEGSTLYIKLSPCRECSKLIYQSGITKVVYQETYRHSEGLDFLDECGVELMCLGTGEVEVTSEKTEYVAPHFTSMKEYKELKP